MFVFFIYIFFFSRQIRFSCDSLSNYDSHETSIKNTKEKKNHLLLMWLKSPSISLYSIQKSPLTSRKKRLFYHFVTKCSIFVFGCNVAILFRFYFGRFKTRRYLSIMPFKFDQITETYSHISAFSVWFKQYFICINSILQLLRQT